MSAWPNDDGAAIDRYVAALHLRHPHAARTYRSELKRFQRFIEAQGVLDEAAVVAWLKDRAAAWPRSLVIDRASKVHRFLDDLVRRGALPTQPFAVLKDRHRQRALTPIVNALLASHPTEALERLRGPVRFGSFLGPVLHEHVELRRALGYRFHTQAAAFAGLDRFLQTRPDLAGQSLGAIVAAYSSGATTLEQRWAAAVLARDLGRAWSRLDSTVTRPVPDRTLRRRVFAERRRPYLYTPEQVARVLDEACKLPSPRAPLRPRTLHTMLTLAYCAGLRLGELVRLNLGDLSIAEGTITIRNSKFHKSRRLPLDPTTVAVLDGYIRERATAEAPTSSSAPLFWRQTRLGGGRYSRVTVGNLLIDVLRRAGLKPATGRRGPRIHDLRHSFVHHRMLAWYRDGIDPQSQLTYLATFLGHKDANSTLHYVTATPKLLQLAAERLRSHHRTVTIAVTEGTP